MGRVCFVPFHGMIAFADPAIKPASARESDDPRSPPTSSRRARTMLAHPGSDTGCAAPCPPQGSGLASRQSTRPPGSFDEDRRLAMIPLVINGQRQNVDLPGETPLLWTLRDELGLTGTKFGCGMALCGACTVHLDGQAIRSCITPISSAANKKVVTIEGLGTDA